MRFGVFGGVVLVLSRAERMNSFISAQNLKSANLLQSVTKRKGVFYFHMSVDVNKNAMCLSTVRNDLY